MNMNRRTAWGYVLFMVPALLFYSVFFMYPSLSSFVYGFTDWNGYTASFRFSGLDNFKRMIHDPTLQAAIKNTFYFAFFGTVIQNAIAIILAVVLDLSVKTVKLLRAVYFTPVLFSPIVVAYIWSFLFSPQNGPINYVLHAICGFPLDFAWLMNTDTSLLSVLIVQIWISLGFAMAIYIAGLQNIPAELYEAGEIDGTNWLTRLRHITLPLLAPAITVNLMLSVIGLMKQFDLVFGLTNGGPGDSSETMTTVLVKNISGQDAGYGSAIGLVLFLMILITAGALYAVLSRREVEV